MGVDGDLLMNTVVVAENVKQDTRDKMTNGMQ